MQTKRRLGLGIKTCLFLLFALLGGLLLKVYAQDWFIHRIPTLDGFTLVAEGLCWLLMTAASGSCLALALRSVNVLASRIVGVLTLGIILCFEIVLGMRLAGQSLSWQALLNAPSVFLPLMTCGYLVALLAIPLITIEFLGNGLSEFWNTLPHAWRRVVSRALASFRWTDSH